MERGQIECFYPACCKQSILGRPSGQAESDITTNKKIPRKFSIIKIYSSEDNDGANNSDNDDVQGDDADLRRRFEMMYIESMQSLNKMCMRRVPYRKKE